MNDASAKTMYVAFTPAGAYCAETKADTEQGCIDKLLHQASHMPYHGWSCDKKGCMGFKERGYTIHEMKDVT